MGNVCYRWEKHKNTIYAFDRRLDNARRNNGKPIVNGALRLYAVVFSQVAAGGKQNNLPDETVARLVEMGLTR